MSRRARGGRVEGVEGVGRGILGGAALALLLGGLSVTLSSPAWGDGSRGRFARGVAVEDQLDLIRVDRRVLLIDARRQRQLEFTLEVGEEVLGMDTRGLVAVVRTSARLMGVTTELATWQELRYSIEDRKSPPDRPVLGDRVALVALQNELAALSTTSAGWQMIDIGPREPRDSIFASTNVAVALTGRRAIAFSPAVSSFVEIRLTPREDIEDVSLQDNSATVTTSRRILIFRSRSGQWTDLLRSARGN